MCFILLSYYISGLVLIIQTSTNLSTFSDAVPFSKQDVLHFIKKYFILINKQSLRSLALLNIILIDLFSKTLKIITYKYFLICKKYWHNINNKSQDSETSRSHKKIGWSFLKSILKSTGPMNFHLTIGPPLQSYLLLGRCHNLII